MEPAGIYGTAIAKCKIAGNGVANNRYVFSLKTAINTPAALTGTIV